MKKVMNSNKITEKNLIISFFHTLNIKKDTHFSKIQRRKMLYFIENYTEDFLML